jgi:hypothetical protein
LLQRVRGLSAFLDCESAIFDRGFVLGVQSDCLIEVGDRAVVLALVREGSTAAVECFRIVRIEFDRSVVIFDGVVVVTLFAIRIAAIVEGSGVLRIELNRLVKVLNGAIVVALAAIRNAVAVVGIGILRFEPDHLIIIANGAVPLALVAIRIAAIDELGRDCVHRGLFINWLAIPANRLHLVQRHLRVLFGLL